MKTVQIRTATTGLSALVVDVADNGEEYDITVSGISRAVLISADRYRELVRAAAEARS